MPACQRLVFVDPLSEATHVHLLKHPAITLAVHARQGLPISCGMRQHHALTQEAFRMFQECFLHRWGGDVGRSERPLSY